MIGTRDDNAKLIEACNLLCEFVTDHLPKGWEIKLTMDAGEASIDLIDPSGDDVWCESPDWGISTLSEMCETAQELDAERHTEQVGES